MLKETMERYGAMVEAALEGFLPAETCRQSRIFEACRYSLMAGGKRIRPMLLLEFYRLCGGKPEEALPFACGLEMIHTYSLIHDDLPCMDDDDYRRGRLSNHKVYGEAMATLAGDALLNRAFEIMLAQTALPANRALAAAACISRCSGIYGMIGGQVQDLALEGKTATLEELQEMVSLKTGALICAAAELGCIAAGGSREQRLAVRRYARALGRAFQVRDDMLDVISTDQELGKPVGSDRTNEKNTFVTALGLDGCAELVDKLTGEAIQALEGFEQAEYHIWLASELAMRTK
jgi:geranylgeranyl diphosphate synthase type II